MAVVAAASPRAAATAITGQDDLVAARRVRVKVKVKVRAAAADAVAVAARRTGKKADECRTCRARSA
jgi:hypothetical protein